jgi:hypothetical protein
MIYPAEHLPQGDVTTLYYTKDEMEWKDAYPGAYEELDPKFPKPMGNNSFTSGIYFDANHAHDEVHQRSISRVLSYVGSTPMSWIRKHLFKNIDGLSFNLATLTLNSVRFLMVSLRRVSASYYVSCEPLPGF